MARFPRLPRSTALVALVLGAAACTTSSPDVVFDTESTSSTGSTPTSTATPIEPSTTTEARSAESTSTTAAPVPSVEASDEVLTGLPGRLAINASPPNAVTVLGEDLVPLIDEASPFAAQPTWSPDASRLAWSVAASDGSAAVVVADVDQGVSRTFAVPFVPFYLQWRPDGGALGLLGGTGGGTGLVILDLEQGVLTPLHDSPSFYFHWSPDGSSMISHLDSARLELIDPATGEITLVPTDTGNFQAPEWTTDGRAILYVRPSSTQTAGAGGGGMAAQVVVLDELVRHEIATDEVTVLAEAIGITHFALAPEGERVAFSAVGSGSGTAMHVVDVVTGEHEAISAGLIFAWQWSPDGRSILLLGVEDRMLAFKVWSDGEVFEYGRASPTVVFVNSYLVFWGQYDLSLSLWAPDSSAFVFAAMDEGIDVIFLQRLTDELPVRVGPGGVAFFAPSSG